MGLIRDFADFLVASRQAGARFDRTLTLGRLINYVAGGSPLPPGALPALRERYAEPFFQQVLGAQAVESLDYSAYEQANIVHDLNLPLPREHEEQYDAVVDGGTLEHVFDYPAAIRNAMLLPKVGGSLYLCTPANNSFGHGLYQFSPDLFHRLLSPANGFRMVKMALVMCYFVEAERGTWSRRFEVKDPAAVGRRSLMLSAYPSLLLVQAVKESPVPARISVLQSDYVALWNQPSAPSGVPASAPPGVGPQGGKGLLRALLALAPARIERYLRSRYEAARFYSVKRHPCFREAPAHFFARDWMRAPGAGLSS